jgi:transcriptional regulator with XRE-family HTH domain
MKDRIILLIKAKNLTAAQFADEIGVQKSSISHIISGRNNASLDFIQKVLLCFPDVNMEWLMFGKGPLFKASEIASNNLENKLLNPVLPQTSPSVDLFSVLNPNMGTDYRKENHLKQEIKIEEPEENKIGDKKENPPQFPEKEKQDGLKEEEPIMRPEQEKVKLGYTIPTTKTILKIVEFYSDNTFREYFPE